MWEFWDIILRYGLNKINERDCKKRQRINKLHKKRLNLFRKLLEPPSYPFLIKTCSKIMLRDAINKIDAEIAQLEREIAEDRYNKDNGKNFDKVFIDDVINYFENTGEIKMDKQEELKRSLAEEKQRVKDSLANVEKMEKQLEELNKKEEQPTVSATGVYLGEQNNERYFTIFGNNIVEEDFCNSGTDKKRFELNNCFTTKEQAEQEALRREGQEFIRRCAMLWNKDNDWRTNMLGGPEYMYYIGYGFRSKLFVNKTNSFVIVGTIYFDNQELAEKCIAELKAKYNEEQIKVIFGIK